MLISLASTILRPPPLHPPPAPLDPRCHLDMLYIFVTKIRWPKGVFGLRGNILKLNLITRYFAFEGQISYFEAYVLRMRSD